MRLYIIGKLISNNKTIAYKIYDSDSKESKIIATKDIMKAMANGTEVHGLRYKVNITGAKNLFLNTNINNITKIDTVDCHGKSLCENQTYILIGIHGFEEARIFHVIDANCQKYEFSINEIKDKNIVGLTERESGIHINSKYNVQVY